ncbi:MAG: 23S rRNA (adenine(2503)-C(2))-methyltransferase RlmN [Phototrophicales bacterium]|nr:MAG: 23S rRNA (adenine(2503)-C(2))-methyltransferase RlmN [Phototrophicales bacterium]RMG71179.1 MAG: 23S rRNA (adenine(2503)-C(2))-methyltransferase RlmN [Chloroflexota bacterium]
MINLYALSKDELTELLTTWGEPPFRAKQVWAWLYDKRVSSMDMMQNIPASLRERLKAEATLGTLSLATEQVSRDGTVKRLYRLPDGQLIESVLMLYDDDRRTACISTQAGCAMGCVFCATGQMGFGRNLSATEIFEQAVYFAQLLQAEGERLSNVVLMGMGEPFHNYDASLTAIRRLMDDLGIGARHITVSTVGLVPQIRRFADEGLQVRLAISLHAATDEERSALLPVNKRWNLAALMQACREYIGKTGRRITFEWALIHGKTDTEAQAHALGKLLSGMLCHVNAIPLNPTKGYLGAPSNLQAAERFQQILESYGVSMSVRVRRGIDIDAGCGQLKASVIAISPQDNAL